MGHSGSEKGSDGFLNEDDVNREAVTIAIDWFKSKGFTIITDNDQMSLTQRIVKANTYQVEGLIEFHSNMGGGTGTQGMKSKVDKSRIPESLCEHVMLISEETKQ